MAAVTAALAQLSRLLTRGARAGAACRVVPEGVDTACRSKTPPWAIKRAAKARRQWGGGERGQGAAVSVVGRVAVVVDNKNEDDSGGRWHQATTNPMMATMVAVADNDGDGGRRR